MIKERSLTARSDFAAADPVPTAAAVGFGRRGTVGFVRPADPVERPAVRTKPHRRERNLDARVRSAPVAVGADPGRGAANRTEPHRAERNLDARVRSA
jgi:hypothetical protein